MTIKPQPSSKSRQATFFRIALACAAIVTPASTLGQQTPQSTPATPPPSPTTSTGQKPASTPPASTQKPPDRSAAYYHFGLAHMYEDMATNYGRPEYATRAIEEYNKIVQLQGNDIESRLLLGQLYTLAHDTPHAEEQFKAAEHIDPNSEDVVLNLARLYSDSGDTTHAIQVLSAVPEDDRTPKMDYALGMSYDQLKDNKNAIDAYSKACDMEPDNLDAERGLAQALLNDNQLSPALKHFEAISTADPQDAPTYLRIAEIERRQGHYEQALTTLKKAKALASDSLEISFNEALIDDSLGRYDDAAQTLQGLVKQTSHPDGQYADAEKNNRSIFLDRLANVYREQNKTDL